METVGAAHSGTLLQSSISMPSFPSIRSKRPSTRFSTVSSRFMSSARNSRGVPSVAVEACRGLPTGGGIGGLGGVIPPEGGGQAAATAFTRGALAGTPMPGDVTVPVGGGRGTELPVGGKALVLFPADGGGSCNGSAICSLSSSRWPMKKCSVLGFRGLPSPSAACDGRLRLVQGLQQQQQQQQRHRTEQDRRKQQPMHLKIHSAIAMTSKRSR